MKPADLQDIVIMQDTTTLAFDTYKTCLDRENLLEFMHPFFMWQDPGICTKDLSTNMATIFYNVMDDKLSDIYLKFAN